jgi:tetratricopeptide (TPR) repeat protein
MRSWRWGVAALTLLAALSAPVGAGAQPGGGMPPMMTGGSKPSPPTVALEKKAQQLEAQYKKQPNPKLKLQVAEAEYQKGHALMTDQALSPRLKYRQALAALRQALKLNPNHKQAKADRDMIESIYRQMGRPIPQ